MTVGGGGGRRPVEGGLTVPAPLISLVRTKILSGVAWVNLTWAAWCVCCKKWILKYDVDSLV